DELLEHALVVGSPNEREVDVDRFLDLASEAIGAPFPLLHPRWIPLDIEMYEVRAERVKVDPLRPDIAGDKDPGSERATERLARSVTLTTVVPTSVRSNDGRAPQGVD